MSFLESSFDELPGKFLLLVLPLPLTPLALLPGLVLLLVLPLPSAPPELLLTPVLLLEGFFDELPGEFPRWGSRRVPLMSFLESSSDELPDESL